MSSDVSDDWWSLPPACHAWPVPYALPIHITREARGIAILRSWQRGRCAVCGDVAALECDHDHATDAVRGFLCNPCNFNEARFDPPVFRLYRERPPTRILGLLVRYGWWQGDLREWPDGAFLDSPHLRRRVVAAQARAIAALEVQFVL